MTDYYRYSVQKDGAFLAGYHWASAVKAQRAYLAEHLRIVRITEGSGEWKIGNTVFSVGKGDILLFNNVTPRQIVSVTNAPLSYELIGFSTHVFGMETQYIRIFYTGNASLPILSAELAVCREVGILFDLIKKRFVSGDPSPSVVAGLVNAACMLIGECFEERYEQEREMGVPSKMSSLLVERAIAYMEENLCHIHSVSEVAEYLHVSRGYFHKLFTRYTGLTPGCFLNHSRIVRFLSKISTEDVTILDAAMACGFESASGFYKTFAAVCGTSPREYLSGENKNL